MSTLVRNFGNQVQIRTERPQLNEKEKENEEDNPTAVKVITK